MSLRGRSLESVSFLFFYHVWFSSHTHLFGIHLHQGELASEAQGMASIQMLTVWEGGEGGRKGEGWGYGSFVVYV
jgi:hypothetical protein